jgi:protein tyrosine/serine phosphatase
MADNNNSSSKVGAYTDSDELANSMASIRVETDSKTIQMDESLPPTPDGTGRPVNFQVIAPGLYRSSYPQVAHFLQLEGLKLKTIVTLVPEELPEPYTAFMSRCGITHYHIPILANKDPERYTPDETVYKVVELMLNKENYPMLIHCNKGKHRTGCITASFRRVIGWTHEACIEEYERYSKPKDRVLDKVFIERFDPQPLKPIAIENNFVGGVYRQPVFGTTNYSSYTAATMNTATTSDESTADDMEKVSSSTIAAMINKAFSSGKTET